PRHHVGRPLPEYLDAAEARLSMVDEDAARREIEGTAATRLEPLGTELVDQVVERDRRGRGLDLLLRDPVHVDLPAPRRSRARTSQRTEGQDQDHRCAHLVHAVTLQLEMKKEGLSTWTLNRRR